MGPSNGAVAPTLGGSINEARTTLYEVLGAIDGLLDYVRGTNPASGGAVPSQPSTDSLADKADDVRRLSIILAERVKELSARI
jgi:hypothetical protein